MEALHRPTMRKGPSCAGGSAAAVDDDEEPDRPSSTSSSSSSTPSTSASASAALNSRLQVPFCELTFHQLIGKGSFKQVYRGKWNNTNVAIIMMRRGGLVTEARVLQRLSSHPNLVQFYRLALPQWRVWHFGRARRRQRRWQR